MLLSSHYDYRNEHILNRKITFDLGDFGLAKKLTSDDLASSVSIQVKKILPSLFLALSHQLLALIPSVPVSYAGCGNSKLYVP